MLRNEKSGAELAKKWSTLRSTVFRKVEATTKIMIM